MHTWCGELNLTPKKTEKNPCMYIWVQRCSWQQFDGPHPKHHREFDISSIILSPLLWYKLEGLSHKACLNTLGRRCMEALKPDFCKKDGKNLRGTEHALGAGTPVRWDSGVAFPRVSGNWHPAFSFGYPVWTKLLWAFEGLFWALISRETNGGLSLKYRAECNAYFRWWTSNLTPNPTLVCIFWCR